MQCEMFHHDMQCPAEAASSVIIRCPDGPDRVKNYCAECLSVLQSVRVACRLHGCVHLARILQGGL